LVYKTNKTCSSFRFRNALAAALNQQNHQIKTEQLQHKHHHVIFIPSSTNIIEDEFSYIIIIIPDIPFKDINTS
jgi:hypothetical protein